MHVTLVTEMSNKQYHSLHIPITLYHANPLIRTRMHRPIFNVLMRIISTCALLQNLTTRVSCNIPHTAYVAICPIR